MKYFSVLLLCLQGSPAAVFGFATGGLAQTRTAPFGTRRRFFQASSAAASSVSATTAVEAPPSWDALALTLGNETTAAGRDEQSVLLTLYRDTNGWCPFCERVWVALRVKQIPYRECLISLQNKPQWYKDLVPTTLVPAVLFHHDVVQSSNAAADDDDEQQDDDGKEAKTAKKNERRLVWESMDILRALDEAFPDTPRLVWDEKPEFAAAMEQVNQVMSAGIRYQFASRNETLSQDDKDELRVEFSDALNALDAAMGVNAGPFYLGSDFTAVDASMIPSMERWRYQLPITTGFDILQDRSNLQEWFDFLDQYEPYAHRVAGDEYSWTAVASTFLRYFGGDESKPEIAAAIERADRAAAKLTQAFATALDDDDASPGTEFAFEAARKLISNHEAIVQDCTRPEPSSQTHLPRASDPETADFVLRHVASVLLKGSAEPEENVIALSKSVPIVELLDDGKKCQDGALAARTVASRLCVPRDLSAPAAKTLRAVLSITADRLEGK